MQQPKKYNMIEEVKKNIKETKKIMKQQPKPRINNNLPVWDMVIEDMQARDKAGLKTYGTRLQPFNGRDALQDLYEELLDACVYCKQQLIEQEAFKIAKQILGGGVKNE